MMSASAPKTRVVARTAAWLLAFGVVSRAQQDGSAPFVPTADCYASEMVGYDFKVEPEGSMMSLHWNVSPFDAVSFKAVSTDPDVGWLSIGFSEDGNMIGSDAVVGSFEAGLVLEYDLGSKTLPVQSSPTLEESISLFPEQEITGGVLERVGNETSLSFGRPSYMDGTSGRQVLFPESGDPVILLWAAGSDESFGYHFLGRGAFSVDLLCAAARATFEPGVTATAAGSDPVLTEAPSMSPDDVLSFSVSPTGAPSSPFPPGPLDDGTTSGGSPRFFTEGALFGLGVYLVQAAGFGLLSIGAHVALADRI